MKMDGFTIVRLIMLVIGTVLFLWFLIPALLTFNPNIGALTGMGLSALMIVYGIWGEKINHLIRTGWKSTGGRIVEILLLFVCAVILVLAAVTGAAMLKGGMGTPKPGATVIVLGARVYGNRVSRSMQSRLDAAIAFLEDNPDSACIVSGGRGDNETVSEASVMYQYLADHGIEKKRIYPEDRSTDTRENLRYSKEIIEREGLDPQIALATNDYHAYRAEKYAEQAGLQAETIMAPTLWWLFPTSVIREMYGILELWLLGG